MKLPRKRVILAWHRWMGVVSALFLAVLSVTGLLLNHTGRLGLDGIEIRNPWILARYGMEGGDSVETYRIRDTDTLSHLADTLYYNQRPVARAKRPIGIHASDRLTAVATEDSLIYLSPSGELIEAVGAEMLPFGEIRALGSGAEGPVFSTDAGLFTVDPDWIEFRPYEGGYTVDALPEAELNAEQTAALLEAFQGGGVSLYRVLLDLHAGRLFGWGGRTLMDLTAIAILLLIASGLAGWLRKSRRAAKVESA